MSDYSRNLMPVALTCEYCGATFHVKPYREDSAQFCSVDCKSAAHRITRVCDWCGETYSVMKYREDMTRFCSLDCLYQGRTTRWEVEQQRGESNGHGELETCGHLPEYRENGSCLRCDLERHGREDRGVKRELTEDSAAPSFTVNPGVSS